MATAEARLEGPVERQLGDVLPPWWLLLVTGIGWTLVVVAFIHPGNTFTALAAIFSFFLVFAGTFDIITSIASRREVEVWWLQLVGGIIEIFLGFWAAGYYGRSAILLIAWVAAFAFIRGGGTSCPRSAYASCSTPAVRPRAVPRRAALLATRGASRAPRGPRPLRTRALRARREPASRDPRRAGPSRSRVRRR
jgi:hypothetical protein